MVTGRTRSQSRPVRRLSTRRTGLDRFDYSGTQVVGIRPRLPPQNRSVPADLLIDKPLGIPRFNALVALSVVSAHKNAGTSSGMQATFERDRNPL
jgi:hypothetical protein